MLIWNTARRHLFLVGFHIHIVKYIQILRVFPKVDRQLFWGVAINRVPKPN